jgi:hypothetical protein
LSQAKEREFRKGSEERVNIMTLSDIKRIIKSLKEKKPGTGRVVSVDVGDQKFNVNTSTEHPPYMQIIIDALIGANQDDKPLPVFEINDNETIVPISIGNNHIIDGFISRCTGGVREGNRIKWDLQDNTYYYDPIQGILTMDSGSSE